MYLLGRNLGVNRRIKLELTVDGKVGTAIVGNLTSTAHFVDKFIIHRAVSRMRKQRATDIPSGQRAHRFARRNRDRGKFLARRVDANGRIAKSQKATFAAVPVGNVGDTARAHGVHPVGKADDGLTRQDNIARGVINAGEHYVDIAEHLQNQGALKRTRHTTRGALGLKLAIRMRKVALAAGGVRLLVGHIDNLDAVKGDAALIGKLLELTAVADQHTFGKMLGGDLCDRLHHGLVFALGKSNAHRLGGSLLAQGLHQVHGSYSISSAVRSISSPMVFMTMTSRTGTSASSSFSIMEVRAIIFIEPLPRVSNVVSGVTSPS